MKQSRNPNIEILGIPIGDKDFCSAFVSRKRLEAKPLLERLEEVGAVDPQVALTLLRMCGKFFRLAHLAHATAGELEKYNGSGMCEVENWQNQPFISLREAARKQAPWNHFVTNAWKCTTGCLNRKCQCVRKNISCSTYCHKSSPCSNCTTYVFFLFKFKLIKMYHVPKNFQQRNSQDY